jgi:ABC-type multidrug transport system fused ATPase/permease subunit
VTFAFNDNGPPALRDIDITLRPRESVALTGASGAGKTTLLDLLLRFYAPGSGTIYINGTPLEHISVADWRCMLAWVGQRPYLFYGSLRDNIRLGRPEAGETAIQAAVRAARVDEFAHRLPRGLDAPVGEKGGRLSRGQAQRVALARAFLADAPLLLLDEPTAGLDRFNENLVAAAITSLSRGRTVITVTHRLDHIRKADRILTLDQGAIVEDGRYAALMAARGPLFHLLRVPGGERP